MSNVLVIGDTHCPFELPGYRRFCLQQYKRWNCNRVVHIGDEVDMHAISFHPVDPEGFSAGHEYAEAKKALRKWFRTFPRATVIVGNHSSRMFRKAFQAGIPSSMLRSYRDMWDAPTGWKWVMKTEIDGVLYTHKPGRGNKNAISVAPLARRQSVVFGHTHAHAGVYYSACERDLIFGLNVGCGLDYESYSMQYAIDLPEKPCIGVGIVLRGRVAHWVPMDLGVNYPR